MFIESVCPKCGEITNMEHHGESVIVVNCKHKHVYDHVVIPYSRTAELKNDKLSMLEEMIVERKFQRMSDRSTICLLIFENGYEVEGRSTVKNIEDFHLVIGKDKAYEHALKRAQEAFGAYLV